MIALDFWEVFASIQIAVFGYVLVEVLMEPGQLLGWHKQRLEVFESGGNYFKTPGDGFSYTKVPWRSYVAKPLGGCVLCTTGQIALWYYLISNLNDLHPVRLVLFVALAIFTVKTADKWLSR